MINIDYTGYLIAAHPLRQNYFLQHGVIFIVENCKKNGTFGLQINQPIEGDFNLISIMKQLGFPTVHVDSTIPMYRGGNSNLNRVHVIHSNDWQTKTTVKFSTKINMTSDVSVLDAISKSNGPRFFRAIIGNCFWNVDELEQQIITSDTEKYENWVYTLSNRKLIFSLDGRDQWSQVLKDAGEFQINRWFI